MIPNETVHVVKHVTLKSTNLCFLDSIYETLVKSCITIDLLDNGALL